MTRRIRFHAFCSIKGGAGKSTLAVVTAKLAAALHRLPVVLDADLTGTSLADGLALCAPKVTLRPDGAMDLDAAPVGEHWTRDETVRLRHRRKQSESAVPPPYLNDALAYEPPSAERDCRLDAMLWTHERPDGVLYLPSSPLRHDIERSVGWLHGDEPFQWIERLAWLLDALLSQMPDVTDLVLDLPPGTVGLAHEALVFLNALSSGEPLPPGYPDLGASSFAFTVQAFLVTTPDWNDILPALEYLANRAVQLPSLPLVPLVNRMAMQSLASLRQEVDRHIDPVLRPLGLEQRLSTVDELRSTLGRIFRDGDLSISEDVLRLSRVLLPEGAT